MVAKVIHFKETKFSKERKKIKNFPIKSQRDNPLSQALALYTGRLS